MARVSFNKEQSGYVTNYLWGKEINKGEYFGLIELFKNFELQIL